MRVVFSVLLTILLAAPGASRGAAPKEKKLIEFGWDEPDTAFLRRHVERMERTPFDGCVFHVNYTTPEGKNTGAFVWECWSTRAFKDSELQASLEDLKATKFNRFRHSLLRFNATPGNVDWFDDAGFAAVASNARLAAKVAREGGVKGILFDIESYNEPLWEYGKLKDAKTKSRAEYAAQIRKRGAEVMRAFQEGYPGGTIFLTYGYCLPYTQVKGDPKKQHRVSYGLLSPFLDGMLDAAKPGDRLIDGCELAYGYEDPPQFDKTYETMREGVLPFVDADHQKYRQVFSFGFGIWMDNQHRKFGWNTEDHSKNYFTPEEFERSVRKAIERTDEYVWIYTETPRWWSAENDGGPVKLPEAYVKALRRAAGRESAAE
jgi:hypothetical protein